MCKQRRIFGGLLFIVTAAYSLPVSAEQFNSFEDIRSKSSIFENRPSFDTAPFTFELGSVTYRVPRNYLVVLPPAIPTIKITFPGFRPLSEETRDCFTPKRVEKTDCATIEFRVLGVSAPGGRSLTHAQSLENYLKNSPRARKRRVLDYDVYDLGPENARSETYSNPTLDLYFTCIIDFTMDRPPERAVCRDQFQLDDRNHAHFFFPRAWIARVPEIESGIRRLMAGFVVSEEQRALSAGEQSKDTNVAERTFAAALKVINDERAKNRANEFDCTQFFAEFYRAKKIEPYVTFFKSRGIPAAIADVNRDHFVSFEIPYRQLRAWGYRNFYRDDRVVLVFTTGSSSSDDITSFSARLFGRVYP